ncbi:unnamed protein product [Miscanthus lutarioriparius]|uniref:Uncharacterized protein n=1 Tax=Miscanthus lutarioriparius TaxID=422564 RepID=A0A811NAR4_9POAL|nr:unnamed protein product [Miscanthus lutarioriparius]
MGCLPALAPSLALAGDLGRPHWRTLPVRRLREEDGKRRCLQACRDGDGGGAWRAARNRPRPSAGDDETALGTDKGYRQSDLALPKSRRRWAFLAGAQQPAEICIAYLQFRWRARDA